MLECVKYDTNNLCNERERATRERER